MMMMKHSPPFAFLAACLVLAAASGAASAHVMIDAARAVAGARVEALLHVTHGCDGAPTTGVTVQIPPGFQAPVPAAREGWKLEVRRSPPAMAAGEPVTQVSWTARNDKAALPGNQPALFKLSGKPAAGAGPLWFKVLQSCGNTSRDWAEIPAQGTSVEGLKLPAALLQQAVPGAALAQSVLVEGAWVRAVVPGQSGTGGFMRLTARTPMTLVGVSTPAAGLAQVHEMKLEGGVMKMRPVDALELPAGKAVALTPGGLHVMLMDLKAPLVKGGSVPMTLVLQDTKGVQSKVEISLPVDTAAPGGAVPAGAATEHAHKH